MSCLKQTPGYKGEPHKYWFIILYRVIQNEGLNFACSPLMNGRPGLFLSQGHPLVIPTTNAFSRWRFNVKMETIGTELTNTEILVPHSSHFTNN